MQAIPQRVTDRALSNVAPGDGGCVLSLYSTGSHGYAQIGWHDETGRRTMTLVHRIAYMALVGPIPDGMTIDHICRTRKCLNPEHLRLLSNQENASDNGQVRTNPISDRICKRHGVPKAISTRGRWPRYYCRQCAAEYKRHRRHAGLLS